MLVIWFLHIRRQIIHWKKKSLWYYVIMVSVIVFGILNLLKKMMQMWNQSWNFVTGIRYTQVHRYTELRHRYTGLT